MTSIFDPLSPDELGRARDLILASHPELGRPSFPSLVLEEPDRLAAVRGAQAEQVGRRARATVLDRDTGRIVEVLVDLSGGEVERSTDVTQGQPPLMVDEYGIVERVAKEAPDFRAALARRGIRDLDLVQIDPVMAGSHPEYPSGLRIAWAVPYEWTRPGGNGYAKPIENVRVLVDIIGEAVVRVVDGPVVPQPPQEGELSASAFRTDLKPLEITQSEGPSFTVHDHDVSWQKWRLHVSLHPVEGLVLHDLRYVDQAYTLTVPLTGIEETGTPRFAVVIAQRFHDAHKRRFGHANVGAPVECVTIRATAVGDIGGIRAVAAATEPARSFPAPASTAEVVFDGVPMATEIHHRDELPPGAEVRGPAIVLQ